MGEITANDVGRNGLTRRDVGKWFVVCPNSHAVYVFKDEPRAREVYKILREN